MGVRTRGRDIAAGLQSSAAGAAAREEATRVIERWNAALAAGRAAL
jgi:mevalonate pyrophosphate decarboxylase